MRMAVAWALSQVLSAAVGVAALLVKEACCRRPALVIRDMMERCMASLVGGSVTALM